MNPLGEQVRHHLTLFHQGRRDDAFHGLLEMDHAGLVDLETAFRTTTDRDERKFLLNIMWQHRQPSIIPLLGEALMDPDPRVWREALDGLVTLAAPAAVGALRAAKARRRDEAFQQWVNEAIEQVEAGLDANAHPAPGE